MKKGKEIKDYQKFHKGIIDTINANKGSLSHHHGVGKMFAPWMKKEIDPVGMGLLQAIKNYFDPSGIINPGNTLGLKD